MTPAQVEATLREMAKSLNLLDVDLPECRCKTCADRADLKAALNRGAACVALVARLAEMQEEDTEDQFGRCVFCDTAVYPSGTAKHASTCLWQQATDLWKG